VSTIGSRAVEDVTRDLPVIELDRPSMPEPLPCMPMPCAYRRVAVRIIGGRR
jgi:hypothetical protein